MRYKGVVRLLRGSKLVTVGQEWRRAALESGRPILIDLGAGDGRFVYEMARRQPDQLFVAIDPDADSLAEYAYRAGRKPARGGVENAFFVIAAVESLPPELLGLASVLHVNFPWGNLLRGLLLPEPEVLAAAASLVAADARFEIVLCYDPLHDTGAFAGEPLPAPDEVYIDAMLAGPYLNAGLLIEARRRLDHEQAIALPSTWGRRLLHARPRPVFLIAGRRLAPSAVPTPEDPLIS